MKQLITSAFAFLLALPFVLADEAQFVITSQWLIVNFRPGFEATTTAWLLAVLGALAVLILAIRKWTHLPRKKHTPVFWLITGVKILVVLAVVYILYSTYDYMYTGVAKTGIEQCGANGCTLSMHWHATLEEMKVCGTIVERPWETGDLAGPHTHKDNRIHLHTILPIDPKTKILLDQTPSTLGGFFDSINWKFSENCFKDTCDACDGKPAMTKVWKNGELLESPFPRLIIENGQQKVVNGTLRDYVWADGEIIRIEFGQ
ncbi:MAG: hypothetical protein ACRD2L_16415 [Terriglobia bacterium]